MSEQHLTIKHITLKDIIRIFNKLSINPDVQWNGTPCWISLKRAPNGYGRASLNSKVLQMHRIMYAWLIGDIPAYVPGKSLEIDHLCRNRACCNPLHLELVSRRVNMERGELTIIYSRTHCYRGHEFTPDNTMVSYNGIRRCKTCHNARSRAYLQDPENRRKHNERTAKSTARRKLRRQNASRP